MISNDGIAPSPLRITAIISVEPLTNVTELKCLLGIVNYLGQYLLNSSTIPQPLDELLVSDRDWIWGTKQGKALTDVKSVIFSASMLECFNPKLPAVVSANVGSYSLSEILLQDNGGSMEVVVFGEMTPHQID